jgi:hypothetical protein
VTAREWPLCCGRHMWRGPEGWACSLCDGPPDNQPALLDTPEPAARVRTVETVGDLL